MTNSERAAADQRLMDAMNATQHRLYQGEMVDVHPACPRTPIRVIGWDLLSLLSARALHRELGEALAAIEAQFGEKPVVEPEVTPYGKMLEQCNESLERLRAMSPAETRESWIKELIVPDYTPVHPGIAPPGPQFNLNSMKPEIALFDTEGVYVEGPQSITVLQMPEDAPGARETIWGSWSDFPTVAK